MRNKGHLLQKISLKIVSRFYLGRIVDGRLGNCLKTLKGLDQMKISVKNTTKIQDTLDLVQARSRTRNINSEDVIKTCKTACKALKILGLLRPEMVGAKFTFVNGIGRVASSYSGIPQSTHFDFEIGKNAIFVTAIYRTYCNVNKKIKFLNLDVFRQNSHEDDTRLSSGWLTGNSNSFKF